MDLGIWCAIAALVLLLLEICVRRFVVVLPTLRLPTRATATAAPAAPVTKGPEVAAPSAPAAPVAPAAKAANADGDGMLGAMARAKKRSGGR